MFFENEEKILSLRKANSILQTSPVDSEFLLLRNKYTSLILSSIAANPKQWDLNASLSIELIGNYFYNKLLELKTDSNKETLDNLFSLCFRLLQEYYISIIQELDEDFRSARKFGIERIQEFSTHAQDHINYSINELPIALIKHLLNNSDLTAIKDFSAIAASAKQMKIDWETDITNKESRVNQLKAKLDGYEAHFNFVGLNDGFKKLAERKEEERKSLLWWLRIFGLAVLIPIIAEISFVYSHINDLELVKNIILYSLIPTSSVVLILVYYFRILIFNYKSVISQLLQIELRMTLCQFIQSYTTYSSEIKANDKESLSKFENIIFSGIVSDDSKMPSTFDGFENISNLVKSLRA